MVCNQTTARKFARLGESKQHLSRRVRDRLFFPVFIASTARCAPADIDGKAKRDTIQTHADYKETMQGGGRGDGRTFSVDLDNRLWLLYGFESNPCVLKEKLTFTQSDKTELATEGLNGGAGRRVPLSCMF